MSDKKYIGYSPNINYIEDYNTDKGSYNYEHPYNTNNQDKEHIQFHNFSTIEDKINKIDSLLNGVFPSKIKDSIYEIYNPIKDIYNKYIKGQPIIYLNNKTRYINNTVGPVSYGLYFETNTLSIVAGCSKTLKVYVIPTNDKTNKVDKWETSDPTIAIVNENGCITGISKGNVIIRATSTYGKYDECLVTILDKSNNNPNNEFDDKYSDDDEFNRPPIDPNTDNNKENTDNSNNDFIVHVSQVSLNRTNIIVKVNYEKTLVATIYPENSYNKKLVWSSNKNNIATVSQEGVIRGISIGDCIITVSSEDGNKTDICNVKVIDDNINTYPDYYPDSNPSTDPNYPPFPTPYPPDSDPDPESDPSDYNDDDDDGPNPDPPLIVVIPDSPSIDPTPEKIISEFNKNMYDLISYYVSTLYDIINKYYKNLLTELSKLNFKNISLLYSDINTSNKDIVSSYRHLLDIGLKNEKLSNLKSNFLLNNFNFNQTLYHLKSFLFAYELRKKYSSIPYSDNTDIKNSISNNALRGCKIDYGLKYDKSYENLYRYLDSSLKVTDNVIDDIIQGMIAKGILIEKGGI